MLSFWKKDKNGAEAAVEPAATPEAAKPSWMDRLRKGLSRTRAQIGAAGSSLGAGVGALGDLFSRRRIDEDLLEELETTLLTADCGVEATTHLIGELRRRWKRDKLETGEQLREVLKELLEALLLPLQQTFDLNAHKPTIIMLAGVNGSGKTTSIGKLAKRFQLTKDEGERVLNQYIASRDLSTWGLVNAVTEAAKESDTIQRRVEMQTIGGRLLPESRMPMLPMAA